MLGAIWTAGGAFAGAPAASPYSPQPEDQIDALVREMTLPEKISLLSGDSTGFNAPALERLGIPKIYMADGPVGVRVGAATAWPVSVNMAASWDTELIYRYGVALAEETLAKGKTCILGPCVGVQRFPLGGRNFESFGEDPWLSSRMAVSYIKGVQSRHVIATVKHYACNDQEWERTRGDSIVDERTLREVHLLPFEAAVREAGVWAVMSSYNLVNGKHSSENKHLLTDILKQEWGFPGIVMSDWVSVHSDADAANAGLDLEMPKAVWFGNRLLDAVKAGKVSEAVIDDKVRRNLRVRMAMGRFEHPLPPKDVSGVENAEHRALALEMAQESITLLKNEGILPLDKRAVKRIAVIGPNAAKTRSGGGGSSGIFPWHTVSPVQGVRDVVGTGVEIVTAEGVSLDKFAVATVPSSVLRTPDGKEQGLRGEYFTNTDFNGTPAFVRIDPMLDLDFKTRGADPRIGTDNFSARWTGLFTPTETRRYFLGTVSDDGSRLYVDGKLLVDNWGSHGMVQETAAIAMEAGRTYSIRIDYFQEGGDAGVKFVWKDSTKSAPEPTIAQAVEAAKGADAVVLCLGNTALQEAEGADVRDFVMPNNQDELVQAVTAANPRTIVVLYGGVPFRVKDWLPRTPALLAAYYPGQEGGDALAQILFGEVNPSGKLPFSYIQERSESPAFEGYQNPDRKMVYREGVFVGYKYYEKHGVTPLFPFGHGLSYTTFAYKNARVQRTGEWTCTVSVDVTNTGQRAGAEVVQLYVGEKAPPLERPLKELKAFSRVRLAAGETRTVSFDLGPRAFRFYDVGLAGWKADHDTFTFSLGSSSREIQQTCTQQF